MIKTANRIIGLFLAAVLFVGLIPSAAFAGTGEHTRDEEHVHDEITFTPWTDANNLPSSPGNYYLTCDVYSSVTWDVPSGETNLCLNGRTIWKNNTTTGIKVALGESLNIYDCEGGGMIRINGNKGIEIRYGVCTLYGGSIVGSENSQGVTITGINGCRAVFNMEGGSVTGFEYEQQSSGGAGVCVNNFGTFNMTGGTININRARYNGGGVYVDGSSSEVNISGGSITSNYVYTGIGGGLYVANGTVNVSGSALIDQNNAGDGGGLYVANGTVNISGSASISRNRSESYGGGVYIQSGSVNVSGNASVTGNTASTKGGGIYLSFQNNNPPTLSISGCPQVTGNTKGDDPSNVHLYQGRVISVTGKLDESARMGITMENGNGVFTSGLPGKGTAANFSSDANGLSAGIDPLSDEAMIAEGQYHNDIWFTEWTDELAASQHGDDTSYTAENSLPAEAGNYYLTCDMSFNETWVVPSGETNLCLNGYAIHCFHSPAMTVSDGASLSIYDCADSGKLVFNGSPGIKIDGGTCALHGTAISVNGNVGIAISSGRCELHGTEMSVVGSGGKGISMNGGVCALHGAEIEVYTSKGIEIWCGECTMYDGTISGMAGAGSQGVTVRGTTSSSPGVFNMYGGTISGFRNSSNGAGVYVYGSGTFNMTGGTISGNKAQQGGGVYVYDSSSAVNISGGSITGNGEDGFQSKGSGLYVNSGTVKIYGSASVGNNTSDTGGGLYVGNGTVNIYGNASVGNNTSVFGGGLYVHGGEVNIYDQASVAGNNADEGGGMYVNGGKVSIYGSASISGNNADSEGGGLEICHGSVSIYGNASVTGNSADLYGGIFLSSYTNNPPTISISGCPQVTGNSASGVTSNVYLSQNKVISVTDELDAGARIGVTLENVTGVFTSGLSGKGSAANFISDNPAYGAVLNGSNEAEIVSAPTAYFETVELRERTWDSKKDLRFVFKLSLNNVKINIDGDYYGMAGATVEVVSIGAYIGVGDTVSSAPFPLNNIFSVERAVNGNNPYCTFTVVLTGIADTTQKYSIQIVYGFSDSTSQTTSIVTRSVDDVS